ncbi:MAG: VWA domain-containing protein [bacterium]|nr:VWA domain-containing protein [bacterium]
MKNKQATPLSFVGALTLAFVPAYVGCRSETQTTEASEDTTTQEVAAVAVQQEVPVAQTSGALLHTGQQVLPVAIQSGMVLASHVEPVTPVPQPAPAMAPAGAGVNVIDLAICLDTSGSMDGLIDSAKQTLWSIVNDMALVEPAPVLRVALLTFGNDGHNAENGWVHVDSHLTTDLDIISQKLFALTTNGGTEYVGRVVNAARADLHWSEDPGALKLLVVAGNESADQDPTISFRDASKNAISAGIMVNSIYCGDAMDNLAPAWREVSLLADGHFASIDADNGMIVIDTPFDEELSALTASVNDTYVPWGEEGAKGCENQWAQDSNNMHLNNDAMAQRAMAKNSTLYVCSWDLVDARKAGQVEIKDVKREFLAKELQGMSDEELAAHVKAQGEKRSGIQEKVTAVAAKRSAWLAAERQKRNVDDSKAMDRVMRDAIRSQAATKGIQFKKEVTAPAVPAAELEPKIDGC